MMNIEKQREEALELLLDWYCDDKKCGDITRCEEGCGFYDYCTKASQIVRGEEDYE